MNTAHPKYMAGGRFSLCLFTATIAGTLLVFYLLGAIFGSKLVPEVWEAQWKAKWWITLSVFILAHLVNAFAEFFFHRYVLHAPVIPFLSHFYRQHTLHHGLTHVVLKKPAGVVSNKYPILEERQHEASFFPWYSLAAFTLVASPLFALVQWLLPNTPIVLGGVLAIAWSLFLYEVLHAIEHWPIETWIPLLEHPRRGRFWKIVYAFHLRHHADIRSNEAISGFFGFPVADWAFQTWVNPNTLYQDGTQVPPEEFKSPNPRWIIGLLDRLAEQSKKRFQPA